MSGNSRSWPLRSSDQPSRRSPLSSTRTSTWGNHRAAVFSWKTRWGGEVCMRYSFIGRHKNIKSEGVRQNLPETIHRNGQIDDDFQLYLSRSSGDRQTLNRTINGWGRRIEDRDKIWDGNIMEGDRGSGLGSNGVPPRPPAHRVEEINCRRFQNNYPLICGARSIGQWGGKRIEVRYEIWDIVNKVRKIIGWR